MDDFAVFALLASALFCVGHPRIHTGVGGTLMGGMAALLSVASLDSSPPKWAVYQTLCVAGVFAWYAWRQLRANR